MFMRAIYGTPDMDEQVRIRDEISRAFDDRRIRTTATQNLGQIHAANLKKAHEQLESNPTIGKVVLKEFA